MEIKKYILLIAMCVSIFSLLQKTEEPEPEQKKFFDVTYVVEFPKPRTSLLRGQTTTAQIKDTVWNKQKHSFAGRSRFKTIIITLGWRVLF